VSPFKNLLQVVPPHRSVAVQNMVGLVEQYLIQGKRNNVHSRHTLQKNQKKKIEKAAYRTRYLGPL